MPGTNTELVRYWDPAIDLAATDLNKYLESWDTSLLRFKPDARPVVFIARPIKTVWDLRFLRTKTTDSERAEAAFRCAIVEVRNLKSRDGRKWDRWQPTIFARKSEQEIADTWQIISDDDLEQFDALTVEGIGHAVLARICLPSELGGILPLPLSCMQPLYVSRDLFAATIGRRLPASGLIGSQPSLETTSNATGTPVHGTASVGANAPVEG